MTAKLMSRDRDLIAVLSSKINVLSFEQAMRAWWDRSGDPKGTVSRRLRTLDKDNHVHVFEAVACSDPKFTDAIVTWSPGDPSPALEAVVEIAKRRAARGTSKRRFVATSRAKATILANGPPELAAHELCLSGLFLRVRNLDSDDADQWRLAPGFGDPRFARAMIGAGGEARHLEVAHSGLVQSIEAILSHCRADGASLEIW